MRRYTYIVLIALALLILALLGWTVQGIRAVTRSRPPRLAAAAG